MIDVHIVTDDSFSEKQKNCIKSLPNFITLHKIEAGDGSFYENKIIGFSKGFNEFVSFIDGDSTIAHGTFEKCLDYLNNNPEVEAIAVASNTDKIFNDIDDKTTIRYVIVFRRKILYKYLNTFSTSTDSNINTLLFNMIENGEILELIPVTSYIWHGHNNDNYYTEEKTAVPLDPNIFNYTAPDWSIVSYQMSIDDANSKLFTAIESAHRRYVGFGIGSTLTHVEKFEEAIDYAAAKYPNDLSGYPLLKITAENLNITVKELTIRIINDKTNWINACCEIEKIQFSTANSLREPNANIGEIIENAIIMLDKI